MQLLHTHSFNFLIFILLIGSLMAADTQTYTANCKLTEATPVNPFPNLKKCYKYNENACCTILHDEYIREVTQKFLPDSCLRKYPEFEDLLCLGCAPLESEYVKGNTLYLCKDFAEALWNASTSEELSKPTKRFDNCGFKVPEERTDLGFSDGFFLPSQTGWDLATFIQKIGIPYYDIRNVEIVDGKSDSCFSASRYINNSLVLVFNLLFLLFL